MTHTNTEQPEALRLVEMYDFGNPAVLGNGWKSAVCVELCRLHIRVQELEAERDEADRRAGRAERHMAGLNDDVRRFEAARRRMKVQWGVHDNVSFDDVWQQALDAKASQAQRVPLSNEQLKAGCKTESCDFSAHIATGFFAGVRYAERAHGITQEKHHGE